LRDFIPENNANNKLVIREFMANWIPVFLFYMYLRK